MRAGRLPSLSSPVSDELDRLRNVIPARPLSAASDGKANTGIHSIYAGTDKDGSARARPPRCAPVHPASFPSDRRGSALYSFGWPASQLTASRRPRPLQTARHIIRVERRIVIGQLLWMHVRKLNIQTKRW